VWSSGDRAVLRAARPASLAGTLQLDLRLEGFAASADTKQRVELWANGGRVERFSLHDRTIEHVKAELPADDTGMLELEFRIAQPTSPADRGLGSDPRALGVRLIEWQVTPAGV
jgi:hypothetical protein